MVVQQKKEGKTKRKIETRGRVFVKTCQAEETRIKNFPPQLENRFKHYLRLSLFRGLASLWLSSLAGGSIILVLDIFIVDSKSFINLGSESNVIIDTGRVS